MRDFEQMLAWLRGLAYPCAPPIGVGEFEVLYASASEVVVWYSPAREGHRAGEVVIPCARLAAAWEALVAGAALDEAALTALGEGIGGGRWLLAVLALVPGAQVDVEPLRLVWSAPRDVTKGGRARRAAGVRTRRTPQPASDGTGQAAAQ
ncbi:MAG TPA: hypothetical protein VGN32_19540 [Ktedonobacterales bacterium]|jgi:hypothetical protein|nr:hypothetical protein [Ktedonobacterales bacterium]